MKALIPAAGVAAILVWGAGLFAEDLARGLLGASVIAAIVLSRRQQQFEAPSWVAPVFGGLLIALPIVVLAHGWSRVLAGRMGIDFALFSQCVHGIATTGVPTTSLLGAEPINFFTHHFAPVLYAPGALTALGVAAPLALLIVHALAFAASLGGLVVAARKLGLTPFVSVSWALVVGLSPNVRPEMLWGVHDEVLSVPFVIWGFVALLDKRPVLSMLLVLASAVGKESYFALPALWLLIVWRWDRPSRRTVMVCSAITLFSMLAGALYVFGQPLWANKSFDHLEKLAPTAATLFSTLGARIGFVSSFFVWLLFLPLVSPRARLVSLAALPFIGLGLVAEDTEMYRFTGYHSIVPHMLLGLSGAVGLAESRSSIVQWFHRQAPTVFVAGLVCLQLSWNARSLWKPAREAATQRWYPAPSLTSLPRDELVAVDPAAALVMLDHRVIRTFVAEERQLSVRRVVARPEGWELPGPFLRETHVACAQDSSWLSWCPKPP